ncbi:hypothetical protein AVEN_269919-1 [Araneus ventricosus]|uniref:Uncharacterized protein n=1 Tax=Araneus ventricosus TaxID=182803 RepID=A0A4Y2FPL2_ARAVE|nr:hypothetical protein AVEN_269919-1 [Araneus ventricosus]
MESVLNLATSEPKNETLPPNYHASHSSLDASVSKRAAVALWYSNGGVALIDSSPMTGHTSVWVVVTCASRNGHYNALITEPEFTNRVGHSFNSPRVPWQSWLDYYYYEKDNPELGFQQSNANRS